MVGIGGQVPNEDANICLGDIVVSKPTSRYGGVVRYDYGKAIIGGLEQTGTLISHLESSLQHLLSYRHIIC
jgi:hypothetical protein